MSEGVQALLMRPAAGRNKLLLCREVLILIVFPNSCQRGVAPEFTSRVGMSFFLNSKTSESWGYYGFWTVWSDYCNTIGKPGVFAKPSIRTDQQTLPGPLHKRKFHGLVQRPQAVSYLVCKGLPYLPSINKGWLQSCLFTNVFVQESYGLNTDLKHLLFHADVF